VAIALALEFCVNAIAIKRNNIGCITNQFLARPKHNGYACEFVCVEHLDPIAFLVRAPSSWVGFKWAANILNDKYLKGCRARSKVLAMALA